MIRLFRFLRPSALAITFVFVLVFLQSLANLYLPTLLADIVDTGIVKNDMNYIIRVGGIMLLVAVGGSIAAIIGSFYSAHVATGF
ncbi:MAG TPA: ABC transporter ATP-binding protein, partial [Ktedonobacterales bacterium]